jgi:uncharacterized Zn-finger protein
VSVSYWNVEENNFIKCPYCGEEYEPSYEDTWIGDKCVNCYTEEKQFVVCDECGKKFSITPYQRSWAYVTETVDGEMTDEEHEVYE